MSKGNNTFFDYGPHVIPARCLSSTHPLPLFLTLTLCQAVIPWICWCFLSLPERSMVNSRQSWLWLLRVLPQWFIALWVTICSSTQCVCVCLSVCGVPILWFAGRVPLISSVVSATAYNGYWQPTTSQQRGEREWEREGRSGRVVETKGHPGKKFHLPVQYKVPIHGCPTLSLHLCLSIKLIITIFTFLRLN